MSSDHLLCSVVVVNCYLSCSVTCGSVTCRAFV